MLNEFETRGSGDQLDSNDPFLTDTQTDIQKRNERCNVNWVRANRTFPREVMMGGMPDRLAPLLAGEGYEIKYDTVDGLLMALRDAALEENELVPDVLSQLDVRAVLPFDPPAYQRMVGNGMAVGVLLKVDGSGDIGLYRLVLTREPKFAETNARLIMALFLARANLEGRKSLGNQNQEIISVASMLTNETQAVIIGAHVERAELYQLQDMKRKQVREDERRFLRRKNLLDSRCLKYMGDVWGVEEHPYPADEEGFQSFLINLTEGLIKPDLREIEKQNKFGDHTMWYISRDTYSAVRGVLEVGELPNETLRRLVEKRMIADLEHSGIRDFDYAAADSLKRNTPLWLNAAQETGLTDKLVNAVINARLELGEKSSQTPEHRGENLALALAKIVRRPEINLKKKQISRVEKIFVDEGPVYYTNELLSAMVVRQLRSGATPGSIKKYLDKLLDRSSGFSEQGKVQAFRKLFDSLAYETTSGLKDEEQRLIKRGEAFTSDWFNHVVAKYPQFLSLNLASTLVNHYDCLTERNAQALTQVLPDMLLYDEVYSTGLKPEDIRHRFVFMYNFDNDQYFIKAFLKNDLIPGRIKRDLVQATVGRILSQEDQRQAIKKELSEYVRYKADLDDRKAVIIKEWADNTSIVKKYLEEAE